MRERGQLIASGRDSDIFAWGPGLVLRRSRDGRSIAHEARVMEYVRARGYPVPAIEEVRSDGTELVMEEIAGRSMVEMMGRRPWTLRRQGWDLARLHRQLHEIDAPEWLPAAPGEPGDRLVHLDLHPLNVMIGQRGAVVIDWSNAARGAGAMDVAVAWLLIASGEMPFGKVTAAALGTGRKMFLNAFLDAADAGEARRHLRDALLWKVNDPHMSDAERRRMRHVVDAASR
jgi:tRNA A-37 threonylcarbamoyl transferase component Bud32